MAGIERRRLIFAQHAASRSHWPAARRPCRRRRAIARRNCCRQRRSARRRSRNWPGYGRSRGNAMPGPTSRMAVERLAVLGEIDALGEALEHGELIGIDDEFLVGADASPPSSQPAACSTKLTPPSKVGHSVLAAFMRGLRIGKLGGAQPAARAEGHAEPARQLRRAEQHDARAPACRRSGRPTASRSRLAKVPNTTGAAGPAELRERHADRGFGEDLGQRADRRSPPTWRPTG